MEEWVEKYRPKSLNDVAGHSKTKEALCYWIESFIRGNKQKPVLLFGPPGSGKTTMAHAIANDYNFDVIELNASDKRNKDVISQVVGTAATSKSLTGKRTLIVLDEVDGLSGNDDRGGVSEIIKVLKNAENPVILTANDVYKPALSSLRNSVTMVDAGSVHTNSIPPVLRKIALKEGFEIDEKVIKLISSHAGGDLRAAINDLQALLTGGSIEIEDAKNLPDRDSEKSIFDAIRIIMKTTHYDIATSATVDLKEELGTVSEWISENLPKEYLKYGDLAKGYDYLSKSDVFLGRVYRRQYFGLWRYASALMTAGTALSKEDKYRGFTRYSPPTVFTKLSRTKVAREKLKEILKKIGIKTHTSIKGARSTLDFLYVIFESNLQMATDLTLYYEFTKEEVEFLTNKKISKDIFSIIECEKTKKTDDKNLMKKDLEEDTFKEKTNEIMPVIPKRPKISDNQISEILTKDNNPKDDVKKASKKPESTSKKQATLDKFF
ncbi:AAA ATPase central domain protein [Methanococcus vannielii SB]|jgi:replication factor C large subunit|uniref:Replication factor C large subunit n=1 Tax=Methanococcus vannielii (strain ATCC 35089 / DSM 1224 / JCM 13029 / OCM 148 / SB) TaxID=406327 RepID=RFCL_METVS|nr:replication factor C large subunit [Methanococcus vannielii]A6URV8.1 RecName: Full=Replication factor C large subunit; Short=RFC large subunit; AltName: Full=Clamp loader large subunit [Methanococcus vannielii SB]ABR55230.1 AAA ATPase central domain protein [Methanococcus vannielii SB]